MDGINESPWLAANDGPARGILLPLVVVCIIAAYYLLLGSWLDLLLNLLFLALRQGSVNGTRCWAAVRASFASAPAILAGWLVVRLVRSIFSKDALTWTGPGKPCLIPCRTTHTRLFPEKHSFSYSYLVVGVPVGCRGNVNGIVSIDERGPSPSWPLSASKRTAWFHVDVVDYLQRGHEGLELRGKLDNFLKSQEVEPSDYPYAYLVTAARFLGYHFNPVSFWYLYSSDKVLSAMVLEVNNTHDERRPYLVLRDFAQEAKQVSDVTPAPGAAPSRMKGSWPKDFFVSPFSSRKGSYSLLANDPLGDMDDSRGLSVTITLRSSKAHTKLVARLFSEGEAVDPSTMSKMQKLQFLLGWFWVGFATMPRITKEAAVLFFRHRLHVWYRPEPLKESLSRRADGVEKTLEGVFRRYLRFLVEQSPRPLFLRYVPSGVADAVDEVYASSTASKKPEEVEHVEVRILTPVFYSRFVHYAHDLEAILDELTENGTVGVDKPHVLPDVFLKKGSPRLHTSGFADFFCFKLIQRLRRRPAKMPQVSTSAKPAPCTRAADTRGFRVSPMDAFVLEQNDGKLMAAYRSAVLRLFVADRLFTGSVELVEGAWRAGLAWVSALFLSTLINTQ